MNILIVASHPDDEVLGCGGVITKYVEKGDNVYCLILGKGRGIEAKEASDILGIKKTFFFDFPDQRYDSIPLLDIIQIIEKVKEEVKPEIVFTHSSGDLNLDHQITQKAVLTAFRPQPKENVKEIYGFEVLSSTEWGSGFKPNVFFDITKEFEKKIKALKAYDSEMREYPHPRSYEGVEVLAKKRGMTVGVEKAEAFELLHFLK